MPNNATRKAARRANIAAAKAARNPGANMFNPNVHTALFNVNSSPLGGTRANPLPVMAYHGSTQLRAPDSFTGAFGRRLSPDQSKQMQKLGLPVRVPAWLGSDQAAVAAIHAENAANTMATKAASSVNTQNDENIRQQMSELNATSTKSLPEDERTAAISSYRGNVLGRLGGKSLINFSNEYKVVNAGTMPRYNPSQANLEWLNEKEQKMGLTPRKYKPTASNKKWLRNKEAQMGIGGAGSHGGRSRKQTRKMRKSRNKRCSYKN